MASALTSTKSDGLTFDEWFGLVKSYMVRRFGLGPDDIEDADYYAYFDNGDDARGTAFTVVLSQMEDLGFSPDEL